MRPGLLVDVVDGSHRADVRFDASPDMTGTDLIWHVEFEVDARAGLWQRVTETLVGEATSNLAAYLAPEEVFTLTAEMPTSLGDAGAAVRLWKDYIWDKGGGLPIPPPVALPPPLMEPSHRMILPPGLVERLVEVDEAGGRIEYTVVNPGPVTYQVYTHRGEVEFQRTSKGELTMVWSVRIRPIRGYGPLVRLFTRLVVESLCKNFLAKSGGKSDDKHRIEAEWELPGI